MGEQVSTGKERDKNVIPLLSGPRCTAGKQQEVILAGGLWQIQPIEGSFVLF